jgi:peptidoglycan/xylan/chitin deacetylase (PgdA/CDA1 family)
MRNSLRHRRPLAHLIALASLAAWLLAGIGPVRAGPLHDDTLRRMRVPILMYHYISVPPPDADQYRLDLSVTPDQFAAQLAWLRDSGFTAVSLDTLYFALAEGARLAPRPVVLTFDDGYADAYTNAFPLLRQFGMIGTFFVVTDWLDTAQPGYLTWPQAREMARAGMSIQSHTRSHKDLTSGCDYDCLVYQILGSVQTIQAEIGTRPRFFCYPGGQYDRAAIQVLSQVGIVAAVTTDAGTFQVSSRLYELKRARMRGSTRVDDLAWMMLDWQQ